MQPVYEANQPITLAETRIVDIDGQPVDAAVQIRQVLSPSPMVIIQYDNMPQAWGYSDKQCQITLEGGLKIKVFVNRPGMVGGPKGLTIYGRLVPVETHITAIDTGKPLQSVQFKLANFPDFFSADGRWVETDNQSRKLSVAQLEDPPWLIEIVSAPNLWKNRQELDSDDGYAITHTGCITRSDGASFSVEDIEPLLEDLRLFLSFARGAWCDLVSVEGKDAGGNDAWVRWGSKVIDPWHSTLSWLPNFGGGEILASIFPSLRQHRLGSWRDTLTLAIDWYLASNRGPLHAGLILSQVALERLSSQMGLGGSGGGAGRPIAKALHKVGIDCQIPAACKELQKFSDEQGTIEHGPHALVELRNDYTHSKSKYGPIPIGMQYEAWNLAQWYVEVILLKLFAYDGSYRNRLTNEKESVPWAK